jgi:hypothetical protein
MSRCKVIQKKQGQINLKDFGIRRQLDIDVHELKAMMDAVEPKPFPQSPYIGEHAEIVWDSTSSQPEWVADLCDQARAVFSLKKEVKGFIVRIYPPAMVVDYSTTTTLERVPMESALKIGARILVPVGSPEMLELFVSTGKRGIAANGKLRMAEGQALMTPLGLAAGTDFTWHNGSHAMEDPRPGFRQTRFNKQPLKRFMVVIDCLNDTGVMMETISGASKAVTSSVEAAGQMTEHVAHTLGLHAVDTIATAAAQPVVSNSAEIPVTTVPVESDVPLPPTAGISSTSLSDFEIIED